MGFWTVGVGHLIGTDLTQLRLSKDMINALMNEDIKIHYAILQDIFGDEFLDTIEEARVAALFTLAFTLGDKFKSWTNTIGLLKTKKWKEAAEIVKGSKWAGDVDPLHRESVGRDDRIVFMLKEGRFDEYYRI